MKHVCKIISSVACAALLFGCSSEAPRSVDALLIDASRDADIGNWQEARTKAEEAYSLQPTNINAGVMYALTLEQNSLSSAIEVLEKVTPNAQGHFMAQFSYGRMLFSRGLNAGGADYFQRALDPLSKALAIEPNHIPTMIYLGKLNMKLGQYDRAFRYFTTVSKNEDFKNKPEAYNEAGVAMSLSYEHGPNDQKKRNAKEYMNQAYYRGKNDPRILYNIAVFYDRYLKNERIAAQLYKKYLSLTADSFNDDKREDVQARLVAIEG